MILKELLMDGFGKFDRKYIEFDSGLNLIFAPNESGKTTVRKSIEAALYGFTNTDSKKKNYNVDYNNFKAGNYRVKLNLLDENNIISIERDLKNEIAKVYVNNNDCTDDYTYVNKILVPGIDFFGVGSNIYGEFFDIDSNSSINNNIVNIIFNTESNANYISNILSIAEKEKEEIGSLNAPTKKRAMLKTKIDEMRQKIKDYDEIEQNIKILRDQLYIEREEIDVKNKSIVIECVIMLLCFVSFFVRTKFPVLYLIPLIFIIISIASIFIKNKKAKKTEPYNNNNEFIKGQISMLEKYMEEKIEDIDNLNLYTEQLKKLDYEYKLTVDAIKVLTQANKNIIDKPKNECVDKARIIFNKISNSNDMFVDDEFNIFLNRDFRLNFEQMSKATKEIANFSLKMATRESILQGGFVILDDAFQFLDDMRLENVLNYFSELVNDGYQVLLLTSNSRIKNILDKNRQKYFLVEM